MISAVDTNVLIDLLVPGAPHAESSEAQLSDALRRGATVISEVVYAELASYFPTGGELDDFLGYTSVRLQPSSPIALQHAGAAWRAYAHGRTVLLECSSCGNRQPVECRRCGVSIRSRQHMMADFIIGAHAFTAADRLLTRDRGFYANYFPELSLGEE